MSRARFPLTVAALALAAGVVATLYLHREAQDAVRRELTERLLATGRSATALLPATAWSTDSLRALMRSNSLDGAFVLDEALRVQQSATGPTGRRVDLLRVDRRRIERAFAGEANVGIGYELGGLDVGGGYFPLPGPDGSIHAVLALEAGTAFSEAKGVISRAFAVSLFLSLLAAMGLALLAAQEVKNERLRRAAAEQAARAEILGRVAASAAHEIRNPLGIIRGTVELLRERRGATLSARDRTALEDVLGEVQRMRQLTDDLLDLSVDRPLALAPLELAPLIDEVASRVEGAFPGVTVRRALPPLPMVEGDAGRLAQVFLNLLQNAAQAIGSGAVGLEGEATVEHVVLRVHDDGPGVSAEVRARLFEPFATDRAQGSGLGLALSRRLVERHHGSLELVDGSSGTTFQVILPRAKA